MNLGVRTSAIAAFAALAIGGGIQSSSSDVLAPFSTEKRALIEAGQAIVESQGAEGVDIAVFGAVRTTADAQRLVAWFREVEQLQRGRYIPVIRRFSNPPQIGDLSALELEEDDLEELQDCRPGHCDLKLAATEMAQIRAAIHNAGRDWQPAAQQAFRRVILGRAQAYLARGFAGSPPYDDHKKRLTLAVEFDRLLTEWQLPGLRIEPVADHLRNYPAETDAPVESLLFWSKDTLGDAKPIVGITHVSIVRGADEHQPTIIASTQVYASHYLTASLSLTAVAGALDTEARYLVYARRTRADLFGGPFGGFLRRIVQKRVRAEGPGVINGVRKKLESGPPRPLFTH